MPFYKKIFYAMLEFATITVAILIVASFFFGIALVPLYIFGFDIQYYKITALISVISSIVLSLISGIFNNTLVSIRYILKGERNGHNSIWF